MNKLWVFAGGCVAGALGLLAAAGLVDERTRLATNAREEDSETGVKEEQEQEEEGEAVRAVE